MIIYILTIIFIIIGLLIITQFSNSNDKKIDATIINPTSSNTESYPIGDYGRYPYIEYEKRDRERRLYDSLTYDFYSV